MELINEEALQAFIKETVNDQIEKYKPKAVEQKMFNRQDAAKYLGISKWKLDKEVKSGNIKPVFPFGGRTRYYLREDLDQAAEKGKAYRKKAAL